MKRNLVILVLLLVSIGSSFAMTTELYGIYGLDYPKTEHTKYSEQSWGGGVSFSNVDPNEFFGVFSNINILYVAEIKRGGVSIPAKDVYDKRFSVDTLLGLRMNPRLFFLTFPIDIGLHVATNWKAGYTALRMGIGGNLGAKVNFGPFGIFARAQLAYDFIQWNFQDHDTTSNNPKIFSVMPQVGLSFAF